MPAQLVLEAVSGVGQRREDREPCGQVLDPFEIGGALQRPLPGLLPSGERLGQQLGLGLADLGKARLHHLGNALLVLLAGAASAGLIGGFLD